MPMNAKMLGTTIKADVTAKLKTCMAPMPDSNGAYKPVAIFDAAAVQAATGVDPKIVVYKGRKMTGTDALVAIMCEAVATQVVNHIQSMAQVTTTVSPGIPVTAPPPSGVGATVGPGTGTGKVL